jgi:hypothetical protein
MVLIGVCREHVHQTRSWMKDTWPHDVVDVYGLDWLRENWQHVLDAMEDTPIVRAAGYTSATA